MRGSSPTSSTILTRAWEQRAHTKCSTCGHPFTCSPRDPRVPPRARWTDLQESFLRLKTTVLPMTKNARPVGVMNGGDSGTSANVVRVCEAKLILADARYRRSRSPAHWLPYPGNLGRAPAQTGTIGV